MSDIKDPDKEPINSEDDQHYVEGFSLKNITPGISPIAAAFIGLLGGFFLYQIVGGVVTLLIFGLKIEDAPVNSMRLLTMGGQVLFILLPALLFTKWFYVDITNILRIKLPKIQELSLFTLGIAILTPLMQYYLLIQSTIIDKLAAVNHTVYSIRQFLDNLNDLVEKTYSNLLTANNFAEGVLIVIVIAVVPAVCEEAMFRGFIQRSFEFRLKPFHAALITAVFFGLYHFNPYGLIPLITLGLYFGFAAYKSDSIFVPVFLHFLNNFTAIMIYFTMGDRDLIDSTTKSNVDLQSAIFYFFVLLVLFSGSVYLINRYYKQNRRSVYADMP